MRDDHWYGEGEKPGSLSGTGSCAYHPRSRAVAACVRCGEAVCADCLQVDKEGALCPHCSGRGGPVPVGIKWDAGQDSSTTPERKSSAVRECSFHAGKPAEGVCSLCSIPICSRCSRSGPHGELCPECHALVSSEKDGGSRSDKIRMQLRRRKEGIRSASPMPKEKVPWSPWPGIRFLPVPLLLAVLITWLVNRGEGFGWGTSALIVSLLLYGGLIAFVAAKVSGFGNPLRMLGWKREGLAVSLAGGLLAGMAGFGVNFALLALSMRIMEGWGWLNRWLAGLLEIRTTEGLSRWDLTVTFLVVLLLAPLCEEVFFRGYLYAAMRGSKSVLGATALNALLFSLVHFSLYGMAGRLALGVIFCLLYEYTGNLAAPLAAHAVNNLLALLLPMLS